MMLRNDIKCGCKIPQIAIQPFLQIEQLLRKHSLKMYISNCWDIRQPVQQIENPEDTYAKGGKTDANHQRLANNRRRCWATFS